MKNLDLGRLLNTLANMGVVAGIVFLAVELRQNNDLMEADRRLNRANQIRSIWDTNVYEPEMAELLVNDRNGTDLTEAEQLRLSSFWMSTLLGIQWQYEEFPDETTYLNGMRRNFAAYPSLRTTWHGSNVGSIAAGKDTFDQDFVEFIEALVPELSTR